MTVCDLDSEDHIDLWSIPKGVQRLAEAEAFTERQMYSRVEAVRKSYLNLRVYRAGEPGCQSDGFPTAW